MAKIFLQPPSPPPPPSPSKASNGPDHISCNFAVGKYVSPTFQPTFNYSNPIIKTSKECVKSIQS